MAIKSIRRKGRHQDINIIHLENGEQLNWMIFNGQDIPRIPFGTHIQISISYEDRDFLNGVDGIVWATYDRHQAETIQNALRVQNIFSKIQELSLNNWHLYLLYIADRADIEKAIDFIWRDNSGMRLQPDWWYPANSANKSFIHWMNDR